MAVLLAQPSYQALPCQNSCACSCGGDFDEGGSYVESPFGWKTEHMAVRAIDVFQPNQSPTISFTASRISKIFACLPIIGQVIGMWRVCEAVREYNFFSKGEGHILHRGPSAQRSITWAVRGAIETIPLIGGIICTIADLIATILFPLLRRK